MGALENDRLFKFDIDALRLKILVIDEDILASYRLRDLSFVFKAKLLVGLQDVGYVNPHPQCC